MKKLLFLLCVSLFLNQQVFAQGGVSGGGLGLVKRDSLGEIIDVKSFDLWRATTYEPNLQIDLGEKSLSTKQKVDLVLTRFAKLDPLRASIIRGFTVGFLAQDPEYVKRVARIGTLPRDTFLQFPNTFIPFVLSDEGYRPELACIQDFSLDIGSAPFTLSMSLWTKMNPENQAALTLHEAIYRMAHLYYGHVMATSTIWFNAFVMSRNLKENPTELDVVRYQEKYIKGLQMSPVAK